MQVEITGRHVEITDPIRSHIHNHLKKLTKHFVEPIDVHVILSVEKHRQAAEVVLKSKLFNLTSIEETGDMYTSVNKAIEKIERQARRQKEKVISHKRHVGSPEPRSEAPQETKGANNSGQSRIIEEKLQGRKPMAVEEALIDLAESELNFVVFRDSQSDGVHVLYRRKDGNIGLIRPN